MEKLARIALLKDMYGALLTDKQQELLDLFYDRDLSLGEIAELLAISRQAVFDNLKRSERALEHYEDKLGFIAKRSNELTLAERLQTAYDERDWSAVKELVDLLRTAE